MEDHKPPPEKWQSISCLMVGSSITNCLFRTGERIREGNTSMVFVYVGFILLLVGVGVALVWQAHLRDRISGRDR